MAVYESKGFSSILRPYKGKLEPFEYIANFSPLVVPEGADIAEYKRTQAPYCLSGKVTPEKNGTYKRNNTSLVYRDLIFLDYDEINTGIDLPKIVSDALFGYSYIIYPTIKHTAENPRYRLVVKPSCIMNEESYKQVVKEIADKIGLPFDMASLTWSQLQGLPVTTGGRADYQKIVEHGLDYPVPKVEPRAKQETTERYKPRASGQRSMTMRIIDTLFNGFGDEGGRNVALTRFVGLLFNKWVDCDIETAYELTKIANSVTDNPLPIEELDRTFTSIARAEFRKRG
ncbi:MULTISPECIES: primase alpha helix C-terminal domain-containing protein [Streptococcus]|uniref:primase alpha helix C-terminal domain-containing protein n=1 Tax=Streptococcus TaxID=1301 RepID=UPI0021F8CF93|nr:MULTISPECIES: primase alpha helix C-terminal domain-containing protein [Streptococcus]MBS6903283.1 primase alpha helix C-terminal domain-containing protein [Streptococcus anginosus]MCW0993904.1 primase alpha helix C-terminal domain-containing protein [Streptococcus anginosus]MCW1397195.1 primase alpha helix C-terminal domain-containing protein [Streptococcus agalactiae]MCW1636908.1 primase alpha helix C-terminal domain-containing protein [Streptococcus agalactiae]MDU1591451.1 primase alpha 